MKYQRHMLFEAKLENQAGTMQMREVVAKDMSDALRYLNEIKDEGMYVTRLVSDRLIDVVADEDCHLEYEVPSDFSERPKNLFKNPAAVVKHG